jgi:hypothetical protein
VDINTKDRFIPPVYAEQKHNPPKVVFGMTVAKYGQPHPQTVQSLRDSIPLVKAAGFEEGFTYTAGNPYISGARAEIARKAMDAKADIIVFLDYDVSWKPEDMVKLLKAEGDVVGGTYRCKVEDDSKYMGAIWTDIYGIPTVRPSDGAIKARALPAGFLKITTACLDKYMRAYPELCYGPQYSLSVDLFNHGAHEGIWWGEDYAFCRRWEACGGENWLIPDMNIDHWGMGGDEDKVWRGNYHKFLLRQPGGSEDPSRVLQEIA